MPDERLDQAITLLKAGQRLEARQLLQAVIRSDPHNERGWLWLVESLDDPAQRVAALEKCLAYCPSSTAARRGLERFAPGLATPAEPNPQPEPEPVMPPQSEPAVPPTPASAPVAAPPPAENRPSPEQVTSPTPRWVFLLVAAAVLVAGIFIGEIAFLVWRGYLR